MSSGCVVMKQEREGWLTFTCRPSHLGRCTYIYKDNFLFNCGDYASWKGHFTEALADILIRDWWGNILMAPMQKHRIDCWLYKIIWAFFFYYFLPFAKSTEPNWNQEPKAVVGQTENTTDGHFNPVNRSQWSFYANCYWLVFTFKVAFKYKQYYFNILMVHFIVHAVSL